MAIPRKILVHVCCTACASHVFKELSKVGFTPVTLFYNPQIDDPEEYEKRLQDLKNFCKTNDVKILIPDYHPLDFLGMIKPFQDKDSIKYISDKSRYQRRRCNLCNSLVIQKTIELARKNHIRYFTTTLLCSPYKDHDEIVTISNEKALDYNTTFYYQDFRKGYWMGRNFARNHNIYISSFCGCAESQKERRLE